MKSISDAGVEIHPAVDGAVRRLAEATKAEAIVLFGSRARGDARPESDWDLCIVLPDDIEPGKFNPGSLWSLCLAGDEAVQVYPIRRSVFEEKRHERNSVSHDVYQDGVILYGNI